MYRVIVHQRLVASDADGWPEREVELPFPPFAGLTLRDICICPSRCDYGDEIDEVAWDAAVFVTLRTKETGASEPDRNSAPSGGDRRPAYSDCDNAMSLAGSRSRPMSMYFRVPKRVPAICLSPGASTR
jgi:hypothetical protein